jgi:hypothetical protein
MKYWGWFVLKLIAAATVLLTIDYAVRALFPRRAPRVYSNLEPFAHDLGYTTIMMVLFLLCYGALHVIIWDQRRRCRTCLRRLRMPIATGSWSNMMLFGQPKTEYICIYGHGTLAIPDVELTGPKRPGWTAHDDDIWKELESYEVRK